MSHWAFVIAAYSVTVLAVAGLLLWSLGSMRSAEAAADKLRRP
jgi:heme exporter protein CcmD